MIQWLLYALTFCFGYYLGTQRNLQADVQQIKKQLKQKLEGNDIGAVKRPSAEKVWEMSNPHIAAEKAEMSRLLEKSLSPIGRNRVGET